MKNVVKKVESSGNTNILITERGTSFGYNTLISDMRSLDIMKDELSYPIIFDATHSVQLPGSKGIKSGGAREFIPVLARAAIASGVSGLFMETHSNPNKALSDGPNSWPLKQMHDLLETLLQIDSAVKTKDFIEDQYY